MKVNGIDIVYETFGDTAAEPVLLTMGFAGQMVHWPASLCEDLASRGCYVIRYDNRDAGLSSKMEHCKMPNLRRLYLLGLLGIRGRVPYTLNDMAQDAVELLKGLNIPAAHIVGASMGGIISQLIAINYPDRALSLTSIMSTTSNRKLPKPDPELMGQILVPVADPTDEAAVIEHSINISKLLMSPGYPTEDRVLRRNVTAVVKRNYCYTGRLRQMAAVTVARDRRKQLQRLSLPAAVIHGEEDRLIPPAGGVDTAANIPGAKLNLVPGMAHDFPEPLMPLFADVIMERVEQSRSARRLTAEGRVHVAA